MNIPTPKQVQAKNRGVVEARAAEIKRELIAQLAAGHTTLRREALPEVTDLLKAEFKEAGWVLYNNGAMGLSLSPL